jgi:single-stranded-DNA-specific exonuclease
VVLKVERSRLGRRWESRCNDQRLAWALAQRLALPETVGRVLAGRGLDLEEVEDFFQPTLRKLLPDPFRFKDMGRAVDRLRAAIEGGEAIAVFGDYDVDGATSSALLKRFLATAGVPLRVYIPDRLKEGYGPNAPALLRLKSEGISLVITVDCGTTAHEALATAAEAGLEVVVLDHHTAEPRLPPVHAMVTRPGGPRHGLRRGAPDRAQPSLRRPGAQGHGRPAQRRPGGPRRRGAARSGARHLSRWLPARAPG